MSSPSYNTASYGPSTRLFGANQVLQPFEVIDAGTMRVAVNMGRIIIGSNAVHVPDTAWYGGPRPQDLLKDGLNESKLLTVREKDYVCLVLSNIENGFPKVALEAIQISEIADERYKRKEKRIIKLAFVHGKIGEGANAVLDIVNIYVGNVQSEVDNLPPFTPIIWPVETDLHAFPKTWRCVFIPGSIHLVNGSSSEVTSLTVNGTSMLDYPVVDITPGEWYVYYEIGTDFKVKNATFEKKRSGSNPDPNIPIPGVFKPKDESLLVLPDVASAPGGSAPLCDDKVHDGKYCIKILAFEPIQGSLKPKMFYKSDICLSTPRPCKQADLWVLDKTGKPAMMRFDVTNVRQVSS